MSPFEVKGRGEIFSQRKIRDKIPENPARGPIKISPVLKGEERNLDTISTFQRPKMTRQKVVYFSCIPHHCRGTFPRCTEEKEDGNPIFRRSSCMSCPVQFARCAIIYRTRGISNWCIICDDLGMMALGWDRVGAGVWWWRPYLVTAWSPVASWEVKYPPWG